MDSNDTVFTLTAHGKSGNIKMDAKRVVHNYYQSDGEAIILENDIIEYKQYFRGGKIVNWDVFMQNRPHDRLNLDQLNKLQNIQKSEIINSTKFTTGNFDEDSD